MSLSPSHLFLSVVGHVTSWHALNSFAQRNMKKFFILEIKVEEHELPRSMNIFFNLRLDTTYTILKGSSPLSASDNSLDIFHISGLHNLICHCRSLTSFHILFFLSLIRKLDTFNFNENSATLLHENIRTSVRFNFTLKKLNAWYHIVRTPILQRINKF